MQAHINGNRALVRERLAAVLDAVDGRALTAFEVAPHVYGDSLSGENAHWLLSKVLAYLTHLRTEGRVRPVPGEPERWIA